MVSQAVLFCEVTVIPQMSNLDISEDELLDMEDVDIE